jgi:hypothetical protein
MTVVAETSTQPTAITFKRSMSTFVADCVVEERHDDSWVITDHPVEQGTTVSDHVYKLPAKVVLTYVWSMLSRVSTTKPNNKTSTTFLQQLYQQLLQIQAANAAGIVSPFSVYTGKRVYQSMLLENLMVTTDAKNENVLSIRASCKELIMVSTTQPNSGTPANPNNNAAPVSQGPMALLPAPTYTPSMEGVTG